MYGNFLSDFLVRLSIAMILVVVNATILHYFVVKLKFKDHSFDNPTSIAIVISALYIILSYLPKFQIFFFVLTNTAIPIILAKEFYDIQWKTAIKFWLYWVMVMITLAALSAFFVVIIF